jgi:hypothetical protein
MQSCEALVVGGIDIGAPPQEQIDARRVAFICRPHEWCVRLRVWDIDWYVLVEQQDQLVDIAVERGRVQQVEALVVGEERVGAVVEEEVDNVVVAALSSPEDGCCDGISTFCVYWGAGLDEEVAEGIVVVDSCPLEHHGQLLSALLWEFCVYFHTCSGVMPCSSLYVASNFPPSNSFCIAPISPRRANCIISSSTGRLGFLSAMSSSSCAPVVVCPSSAAGGVVAEAISEVRVGEGECREVSGLTRRIAGVVGRGRGVTGL